MGRTVVRRVGSMPRRAAPEVVVLGSQDSLRGLAHAAARRGLRVRLIDALRTVPVAAWETRGRTLAPGDLDTVLVTSRHAVVPALVRWLRARRSDSPRLEAWAAGPETARELRRSGFPNVRRGQGLGVRGILARLGSRPRRILYVRSDLAGSATARELRAGGHRVVERIVYRTRPFPSGVRHEVRALRRAAVVIATSPSALRALRLGLGRADLRAFTSRIPLVVLGPRSARAARALGFRNVSTCPETTPQGLAVHLVRTLRHAAR